MDLAGSSDGASDDADTDTGAGLTGEGGETSSDSGLTGDPTDGVTDGGTTGGFDPDGDSSGTGEDDGPGVTEECFDVDCSGGGECEYGDDGPQCVCNDGWTSVGLDCLPCDPIAGDTLPAVVPAVRTSFRYSFDGAEPPTAANQYGRLSLRNRTTGDVVPLPDTLFGSATVLLVPGTYDVLYQHRSGNILPKNNAAVLQQVTIEDNDLDVNIDIVGASLRGAITFGEDDEPQSPAVNYGRLWAVNTATGDRVRLADSFEGTYDVLLVPGTYDIRYEARQAQGEAPVNKDGSLGEVYVGPGSNEADLHIEVVRVTGQAFIDGAPLIAADANGDLELRDLTTGDRFPLAGTEDPEGIDVLLLPGSYEVVYNVKETGPGAPINVGAVVHEFSVGIDNATENVEIETALIEGSFTLNNGDIPMSSVDDGVVLLESPTGGTATLGVTSTGSYSARVLQGSYDVFYSQETAGISMPANTHARLEPLKVTSDALENIDVRAVEIAGEVTIAGMPAPTSPYDDGRLLLRNAESGDKVLLGNTRQRSFVARVVPGLYDVVYENEFSDIQLPVNRGAVIFEGLDIQQDMDALELDVPVTTFEGAVQIQGSNPSTDEGIGNLFLRDVNSGDEVFIGHTGTAEFSKPLTDGTYLVEYRGVAAEGATLGTSLPANEKAAFACFEVVSE